MQCQYLYIYVSIQRLEKRRIISDVVYGILKISAFGRDYMVAGGFEIDYYVFAAIVVVCLAFEAELRVSDGGGGGGGGGGADPRIR